jgi:DNA-binding beta-propeller fold protein YncE
MNPSRLYRNLTAGIFYMPKHFRRVKIAVIALFCSFQAAAACSAYEFTAKQKAETEKDNNIFAAKGYAVENLLYKDKLTGAPVLFSAAGPDRLCIMNNKNKFFLTKPGTDVSWEEAEFPSGEEAFDIAVSADGGVIIGLKENEIFKFSGGGKRVLAKIPDSIRHPSLAVNRKNKVYLIDGEDGRVYYLDSRGGLSPIALGSQAADICFDQDDNMYILDRRTGIHVLSPSGKEMISGYNIPLKGSPVKIAVNNNGSQIYLWDAQNKELSSITKFGIYQKIAYFGSYHTPRSKPVIGPGESIYLLVGTALSKVNRIVKIRPEDPCSSNYNKVYRLEPGYSDALGSDSEDNLYFMNAGNLMKEKKGARSPAVELAGRGIGLMDPEGISFDSRGDCYIADDAAVKVFRINKSDKSVSVYADKSQGLKEPQAIVFDRAGNAFIGDEKAKAIFKISPDGVVTKFAGEKDGLRCLESIAIDSKDYIYVAPEYNDRILKVSPAGDVSVFADRNSGLIGPGSIAIGRDDFVYAADEETSAVYKFNPQGGLEGEVKINKTTLRHLGGIAVSSENKVYVLSAAIDESLVYSVNFKKPGEKPSLIRRGAYSIQKVCGWEDGLSMPYAVAVSPDKKTLYIAASEAIFKYSQGRLTPACKISGAFIREIAIDQHGDIIAVDGAGGKVYRVGKDRKVDMLISRKDGLAAPEGIALDKEGRIYVADESARKVFVLDNNQVRTVRGVEFSQPEKIINSGGYFYVAEDGDARFSKISIDPGDDFKAALIDSALVPGSEGIAVADDGSIYLSCDGPSRVYKFKQMNDKKTVLADSKDGLVGPESLALDADGNLYVADPGARAVFKITEIRTSRKE